MTSKLPQITQLDPPSLPQMVQQEIKPNMRQIVTSWMLEVTFSKISNLTHPALLIWCLCVSKTFCPTDKSNLEFCFVPADNQFCAFFSPRLSPK